MSRLELKLESWFQVDLGASRTRKWSNFLLLFIAENLWMIGFMSFVSLLWPMFGKYVPPPSYNDPIEMIYGETKIWTLFVACIVAPVFEEILFRWIPVRFAEQASRRLYVPILVMSQFIFAYMHGVNEFVYFIQGIGGLALTWIYIRNGKNLWWSIGYHALWNLIQTVLEWI